jgi:predicted small secreted protein
MALMLVLAGCNAQRGEPAAGRDVEAAVERAERELAAARAKREPDRNYAQAYASLPY